MRPETIPVQWCNSILTHFWRNFWCKAESKSCPNQIASLKRNRLRWPFWYIQKKSIIEWVLKATDQILRGEREKKANNFLQEESYWISPSIHPLQSASHTIPASCLYPSCRDSYSNQPISAYPLSSYPILPHPSYPVSAYIFPRLSKPRVSLCFGKD